METFAFEFHPRYRYLVLPLGVTPENSFVEVGDGEFHVKFGMWKIRTPLSNISGYQRSGDYKWFKAIGIRGSFADYGLTFGTTTRQGVCVKFVDPIKPFIAAIPHHPGLTVTVADPNGLVAALEKESINLSD